MTEAMIVFNRQTIRRHRARAAANLEKYDFLFKETSERLCDRLDDITRTFPDHDYFLEGQIGRDSLRRILQANALSQPNINYCQSLNFVAGTLLLTMSGVLASIMW